MGDTSNSVAPRVQDHTPPPNEVADGAQTCIRYVQKNLGIALDYQTETLPVLDHYLREARSSSTPETTELIASVAGCYLGEVLRFRHPLTWNTQHDDPLLWSLSAPSITIFPLAIARVALDGPDVERQLETFRLAPNLQKALARRLQALPPVPDEEYIAPSTRVEVVDIAFDLLTGSTQPDEHVEHEGHEDHDHVCDEHCDHD